MTEHWHVDTSAAQSQLVIRACGQKYTHIHNRHVFPEALWTWCERGQMCWQSPCIQSSQHRERERSKERIWGLEISHLHKTRIIICYICIIVQMILWCVKTTLILQYGSVLGAPCPSMTTWKGIWTEFVSENMNPSFGYNRKPALSILKVCLQFYSSMWGHKTFWKFKQKQRKTIPSQFQHFTQTLLGVGPLPQQ